MSDSPLSEVVRDQRINEILELVRSSLRSGQPVTLSPKDVDYIRRSLTNSTLLGQAKLHDAAVAIWRWFLPNEPYKATFIVIGRCGSDQDGRIITSEIDFTEKEAELLTTTDSLLSEKYAPVCERTGNRSTVIASFVEFHPKVPTDRMLQMLFTRVKSTSNLCYKVADLVMDIDHLFRRDKIYNQFSQLVTDMYGLKAVVAQDDQVLPFLDRFRSLPGIEIVDEKDYLGPQKKKSGYEAFKLAFKQDRHLFEFQVQSRRMYDIEKSSKDANHRTYKERQMAERRKLGKEYIELYRFLSQLFTTPESHVCDIQYLELNHSRKGMDDEF